MYENRMAFQPGTRSLVGRIFQTPCGMREGMFKKVLGNAKLTFDELLTVVIEVEGTLNSRPLTYMYEELDKDVLTPSHLIHGRHV
jgi:hypothetical protein